MRIIHDGRQLGRVEDGVLVPEVELTEGDIKYLTEIGVKIEVRHEDDKG